MPTLTLAIPEDLKRTIDSMPEMNWSEVARNAISERAAEYALFKSIVAKSKLTRGDAQNIGEKINEQIYKKFRQKLDERKAKSSPEDFRE